MENKREELFREWKRQLSLVNTLFMYRAYPKESEVSDDEAVAAAEELEHTFGALAETLNNIIGQ